MNRERKAIVPPHSTPAREETAKRLREERKKKALANVTSRMSLMEKRIARREAKLEKIRPLLEEMPEIYREIEKLEKQPRQGDRERHEQHIIRLRAKLLKMKTLVDEILNENRKIMRFYGDSIIAFGLSTGEESWRKSVSRQKEFNNFRKSIETEISKIDEFLASAEKT